MPRIAKRSAMYYAPELFCSTMYYMNKPRDQVLTIRMCKKELEAIQAIAQAEEVPVSQWVRKAIKEKIERTK